MNKPFFSVIIPVYNVEKYLFCCLDSVLSQTFSDYEVILIDDGSMDSSGRICDDYAKRYSGKIQVQHKPNQGLISARRAGLKLSNGQYVCFLDSDDCWVDNTLSRLHEIIDKTDSDVVLFGWNRIDENGKKLNIVEPALFSSGCILDNKTVFERILSTSSLNSLCKKCCKLELFDIENDYSQYYSIQNGEDLIQSLPVLYKAKKIYYLDEPLYLYRVNTASITQVYRKGQHQSTNIVRPLLYKYIVKMGLDTEQNKKVFFNTYLEFLWQDVEAIYKGMSSAKEQNAALDELHSYEFVQKGKEYLGVCALSKQAYLGLSIFYKNNSKIMSIYMRLYLPVIKTLRGVKAALRKLNK